MAGGVKLAGGGSADEDGGEVYRASVARGMRAELDVAAAYTEPSVHDADADWGRHRDAIASLAAAGVTWVIVPGQAGTRDSCTAFLERFGKEIAGVAG